MKEITYITGNQNKADRLASYLEYPILHHKMDLDEIQSLDLKKIVRHKVKQAYEIIKRPLIVEDTSLEFKALGGLPGPFIKFFLDKMPLEDICAMLNNKDRNATARSIFGYFDGQNEAYFESSADGSIAEKPAGDQGFGFDKIFIPEGFNVTRAELNEEDRKTIYLKIKPNKQLRDFLEKL